MTHPGVTLPAFLCASLVITGQEAGVPVARRNLHRGPLALDATASTTLRRLFVVER
ncbi:MAG: hypothetical protein HPY44_13110 [Armatimonadetes bacterium]|nr:hypothetical protein [Armatimonadota bacterium]